MHIIGGVRSSRLYMTWIVEFAGTIVLDMIFFTPFLCFSIRRLQLPASFLFVDEAGWSKGVIVRVAVWVWILSLIFIQSSMQTVGRLPCLSSPRGECNPWLDAVVEFEHVGPSY
jgi:hypothetical protein